MEMTRGYMLIVLLALTVIVPAWPAHAQSDGYPYSIMKPEPGSRAARRNKTPHATVPRETEPQETDKEAVKPSPTRGSSNPVYPTRLPAPERYTPPTSRAVVNRPPAVPPSMYVPQTGQTLPNLPSVSGAGRGGAETFQDRAARCSHQAGVYGPGSTGDRNSYVGGCINQ
jgi:hypothetical protein